MLIYAFRRLLLIFPTLLGVSLVIFAILALSPGDPLAAVVSEEYGNTAEDIERIREQLHLNDPLHVQYFNFLWDALRGDLGTSFRGGSSVLNDILARLPSTIALALAGLLVSIVLGLSAGVLAALYRGCRARQAHDGFHLRRRVDPKRLCLAPVDADLRPGVALVQGGGR